MAKITKKPSKPSKPTKVASKATPKATESKMKAKKVFAEIVEDPSDQDETIENLEAEEGYQESDPSFAELPVVESDDKDPVIGELVEKIAPTNSQSKNRSIATADPIASYLAEIRKYPLLTKEQEQELAKKYYETKDPAVAQALVTANLRFVVKIAAEYSRFGARMIDLVQEGNMGLMHGVRDFNPYKGVRLITYAVWWIRGYIQEYLMKQYSLVKIGTTQNQKKLFYQLQRQREELDAMGKSPDIKQLSSKLGIPEDEVEIMAQRMSGRDVSLDRPTGDDSSTTLMDFQQSKYESAPDEELGKMEEISHLHEAIEALRPKLSAREKIILEERILNDEPLTLQEIGDKHGITREAVRQMEARLMQKIKDQFNKN